MHMIQQIFIWMPRAILNARTTIMNKVDTIHVTNNLTVKGRRLVKTKFYNKNNKKSQKS